MFFSFSSCGSYWCAFRSHLRSPCEGRVASSRNVFVSVVGSSYALANALSPVSCICASISSTLKILDSHSQCLKHVVCCRCCLSLGSGLALTIVTVIIVLVFDVKLLRGMPVRHCQQSSPQSVDNKNMQTDPSSPFTPFIS